MPDSPTDEEYTNLIPNFSFDRNDILSIFPITVFIIGSIQFLDKSLIAAVVSLLLGIIVETVIVTSKLEQTPKSIRFTNNGIKLKRYLYEDKYVSWDSIQNIKKIWKSSANSCYSITVKELVNPDETHPLLRNEKIKYYVLKPEIGRLILLIQNKTINYNQISDYLPQTSFEIASSWEAESSPNEIRHKAESKLSRITPLIKIGLVFMLFILVLSLYRLYRGAIHHVITLMAYFGLVAFFTIRLLYVKRKTLKELEAISEGEGFDNSDSKITNTPR